MEITRMRGMLEDEFKQKKTDIKVSETDYNLDLVKFCNRKAREKRDREEKERQDKLAHEQNEIRILHQRGVKRPYP